MGQKQAGMEIYFAAVNVLLDRLIRQHCTHHKHAKLRRRCSHGAAQSRINEWEKLREAVHGTFVQVRRCQLRRARWHRVSTEQRQPNTTVKRRHKPGAAKKRSQSSMLTRSEEGRRTGQIAPALRSSARQPTPPHLQRSTRHVNQSAARSVRRGIQLASEQRSSTHPLRCS